VSNVQVHDSTGRTYFRRAKRQRYRVRCLGPKKEEHWFMSFDKCGGRVCPRCRDEQRRQMDCGKAGLRPVHVGIE